MGLINAIVFLLTITYSCSLTMNHCRRSLHLLTGAFPSPPQGKSYARYATSISNGYNADASISSECDGDRDRERDGDVRSDMRSDTRGPEERYDNVTEGLKQLNSSWEFGTFNYKSTPTLRDIEEFEATKLLAANTISTEVNWVDQLTDDEVNSKTV